MSIFYIPPDIIKINPPKIHGYTPGFEHRAFSLLNRKDREIERLRARVKELEQ